MEKSEEQSEERFQQKAPEAIRTSCDLIQKRADDRALRANPQEIRTIFGAAVRRAIALECISERKKKEALQQLRLAPEARRKSFQQVVHKTRALRRRFQKIGGHISGVLNTHPTFDNELYRRTAIFCGCYTPDEVIQNEALCLEFMDLQWPEFQYLKPGHTHEDITDFQTFFKAYSDEIAKEAHDENLRDKLRFIYSRRLNLKMLTDIWIAYDFHRTNEKALLEAGVREQYREGLLTYSEMKMQLFGLMEYKTYAEATDEVVDSFEAAFTKYSKGQVPEQNVQDSADQTLETMEETAEKQPEELVREAERLLQEYLADPKRKKTDKIFGKGQEKVKRIYALRLKERLLDILITHPDDKVPIKFVKDKVEQLARVVAKLFTNPYLMNLDDETAFRLFDETLSQILYPGYLIHMHLAIGGSEDPVNVRMGAYFIAPLQIIKTFLDAGVHPPVLKIVHAKALADEINGLDPAVSGIVAEMTERFSEAFIKRFFPECWPFVKLERPQDYADFTDAIFEQNVQLLENLDGLPTTLGQQVVYYLDCIRAELASDVKKQNYLLGAVMKQINEFLKRYKSDSFRIEKDPADTQASVQIPDQYVKEPRAAKLFEKYGIPLCRILILCDRIQKDQGQTLAKLREKGLRHGKESGEKRATSYIAAHPQAALLGNIHTWNSTSNINQIPNAVWKIGGAREAPFTFFQQILVNYLLSRAEHIQLLAKKDQPDNAEAIVSAIIPGAARGSQAFHAIPFIKTLAGSDVCPYYTADKEVTLEEVFENKKLDMATITGRYSGEIQDGGQASQDRQEDINIVNAVCGQAYIPFVRQFIAQWKKTPPSYKLVIFDQRPGQNRPPFNGGSSTWTSPAAINGDTASTITVIPEISS